MSVSVASGSSSPQAEVWLRGNLRPVLAIAAAAAVGGAGLIAALLAASATPLVLWIVGAGMAVLLGAVAVLADAARRPRLARRGDRLVVRVSPATVAEVPLDVVECFFPGSNPIDASGSPTCGEHAAFRVGTLVARVAERAEAYRQHDTFRPWVVWEDGYIVIDGRWCEPLSPPLARDLAGRLMAAKRSVAAGSAGG